MHDVTLQPQAASPYLRFDEEGLPYLLGMRCGACGAVAPGSRMACNACGNRHGNEPIQLEEHGTLYSYTIVHRSFPGVETPFISAIVDLAGGGAIKGTLVEVPADPSAISFAMPIKVVFRDTGQTTADGAPFLSYYFTPSLDVSS